MAHKIRLNSTDAQALLFETWAEALRRELGAVGEGAPAPRLRGRPAIQAVQPSRHGPPSASPGAPIRTHRKPSAASLSRLLTKVRREAPADTTEWMRPPGSRPRLPAAAQGSGRRLVRLYNAGARPNRESTARRTRSGRRCRSGATPGGPSTSPARTFASSTGTSRFRGAIARARRRRRAFGRAWSGGPFRRKPGGGQMR